MNANNGNDDNFDIENTRNLNEPNIIPNIERNVINIKFEEKKQGVIWWKVQITYLKKIT